MNLRDIITEQCAKCWDQLTVEKKADIAKKTLRATTVENPVIKAIANSKWLDLPEMIRDIHFKEPMMTEESKP